MTDLDEHWCGLPCPRCGAHDDTECVCLEPQHHDAWCPGLSSTTVIEGPRTPPRVVELVDERRCTCTLHGRRASREQLALL